MNSKYDCYEDESKLNNKLEELDINKRLVNKLPKKE